MERSIRLLVVDDFAPWHLFASSILHTHPEVQIVGDAFSGLEGIQKARELQPDLVLLDVSMPALNGLQAARQILGASQRVKIIFASECRSPEIAEEAINLGALGFVLKTNASTELLPAIRTVLEGSCFVSAGIGYDPNHTRHEFKHFPSDEPLLEGLANFVRGVLRNGDPALVLATESHHAGILQKLTSDGVDVAAAVREKRYFAAVLPESPTLDVVKYLTQSLAKTTQEMSARIGVG